MKIVITSTNPVKTNATLQAFRLCFPSEEITIEEVLVPSGVSDQPLSEEETLQGAIQRVENARVIKEDADYWVGIEGGIVRNNDEMVCFAWIYILSKEHKTGKGRTGTFFLPPRIVELVNQGYELGEADDIVFAQVDSKKKQGTVGILTKNVIDRTEYYVPAVVFALIPFVNPELY